MKGFKGKEKDWKAFCDALLRSREAVVTDVDDIKVITVPGKPQENPFWFWVAVILFLAVLLG